MKIQVSKVMAKEIAKALTSKNIKFDECKMVCMSERSYRLNVGGTFGVLDAQDYGDYDWRKDEYKAISIVYPYDYYAMPKYITTKTLVKLYNKSAKTLESLMDQICDYIAI